MIELRLLGTLQLSAADGRDLTALARQSKRTALLLYLAAAVPYGLHRRETLLALFWPELDETKARSALSQALYVLRNALGEQAIVTRGDDEVGISRSVVWCDVHAFETALDAGQFAEALVLYRGGLLNGFSLSDAPELGRWVDQERERLRERAAEGAWALAEARAAAGDAVHATRWARWAAGLASADEAVIRRLMTFLLRLGDRAAAIRAYETFADRLSQEFELEPSAETQSLAKEIRNERQVVAGIELPKPSPTNAPAPAAARDRTSVRWAGLVGIIAGIVLVAALVLRVVTAHGGSTIRSTAEERAPLASARRVDPEVYALSLKGSHECLLWNDGNSHTKESYQRGVQLLREAVDRDATYAVAYVNLAGCYLDMSYFGVMPDSEAIPLARAANQKAFQLDSTLGEAYLNRGWIRFAYDHDRDGSDQDFRRAVELSPGDVRTRQWYADYLMVTGRFDDAIDQKRKAIALDPLSVESSIGLGAAYFWARRYDEAIAQFKVTLHMAPGSLGARMQLAWNYSLKGMHEEAVVQCDSALTFAPHSEQDRLDTCGWVYARAGRRSQVLEMLQRTSGCDSYEVYAALGELERALACIRKRVRENPQDLALENFSPRLDPLRSDPRAHLQLHELGIN